MAEMNLGRVQGASYFYTSASCTTATTSIEKSTLTPTDINPLVGDKVMSPDGLLFNITATGDTLTVTYATTLSSSHLYFHAISGNLPGTRIRSFFAVLYTTSSEPFTPDTLAEYLVTLSEYYRTTDDRLWVNGIPAVGLIMDNNEQIETLCAYANDDGMPELRVTARPADSEYAGMSEVAYYEVGANFYDYVTQIF